MMGLEGLQDVNHGVVPRHTLGAISATSGAATGVLNAGQIMEVALRHCIDHTRVQTT